MRFLLGLLATLFLAQPALAIEATRGIAYGDHPAQLFDVYARKDARNDPVIVMLHGGGWAIGSRGNRRVWKAKADYFVPRGHIFVSVDTRLIDDGADPIQQARDLAHAVAAIRSRAAGWGGDPDRILLMGHSAGGHIAALVAADPEMRRIAGPVRGTVILDSGALDLESVMADNPPRIYRRAFGADPAYWRDASPLAMLEPGLAPVLAVCSTRRRTICPASRRFAGRAAELGSPAHVLPANKSHMEINTDLGRPGTYTETIAEWIAAKFR